MVERGQDLGQQDEVDILGKDGPTPWSQTYMGWQMQAHTGRQQ
jgi:hypothetical protein